MRYSFFSFFPEYTKESLNSYLTITYTKIDICNTILQYSIKTSYIQGR